MIKGVHHISLNCSEAQLPEVRHFYSELLGLKIVREWPKGIMVEAGNCWIEIMIGDANRLKGAVRHFAFYHFGKSTTPDRPDQTWVNCLNLFVTGYTV